MIGIIRTLLTRLAIMALCYLVSACETISIRIVGAFTLDTAIAVYVIVQFRLKLGGQFIDCYGELSIATCNLAD